jgi:DNA-binding PadR family transcriptional regulator
MGKSILPMSFRMLHYFSTVSEATVDHLMAALKSEYGTEKQFSRKNISNSLFSMRENGIIEDSKVELDHAGELNIYYRINDEGSGLLKKYLPKEWQVA